MKRKLGKKRFHWTGSPLPVKQSRIFQEVVATLMVAGPHGCPRCAGWVTRATDYGFQDNQGVDYLKCMLCGAREYPDTLGIDGGQN